MFNLLSWTGNQKAIVGGVVSFALTLLAQYNVNQNTTLEELLTALATGILTHLAVWFKTNTK